MSRLRYLPSLFKQFIALLLCLSIIITPQIVWAANILVLTSLTSFETDLGNATLSVTGIDSHMQLTVTPQGKLTVSQFSAKQVTLRYKPANEQAPTTSQPQAPLPAHIHIPLPFYLHLGQIEQLTIIQGQSITQVSHLQFDLDADNTALQFNISQAHSPWGNLSSHFKMQNAAPFNLSGWLDLQQPQGDLPYHLRMTLAGNLTRLEMTANHHYQPEARPFALIPVEMSGPEPSTKDAINKNPINKHQKILDTVQLQASIGLDDQRQSHLAFHLQQFQAKHLHPQLGGAMDLNIVADGSLTEQGLVNITVDAGNSRLQQQPLILKGQAQLRGSVLSLLDLKAQLDQNTLSIQTQPLSQAKPWSTQQTHLIWQANLASLAQLMPGFSGKLQGQGDITQGEGSFSTSYHLSGTQLQLPKGLSLAGLQVDGHFSNQSQATLDNQIQLQGLSQQDARGMDSPPIDAELKLKGNLDQHQLTFTVTDSDAQRQRNLLLALNGHWQDSGLQNPGWQATLTQLQDQAGKVFQLEKPAALTWQPEQGFQLRDFILKAKSGGQLQVTALHYRPPQAPNARTQAPGQAVALHTQGALDHFPVQALLGWLGQGSAEALPADALRLSGQWSLALDQHLNGSLHLERSDGDWQIFDTTANAWQALGIQTLQADWQASNDRMQLQATLQSNGDAQRAIDLQFSAATEVTPTADGLVIKKTAPLQAMLKAHLPQLNWLNKLLPDTQVGGQLNIQAAAHGTIAQPSLQGSMQGSALSLQVPSQGLWLEQGSLNATLATDQIHLQQLHFAGKSGELNGTGVFQFNQEDWQLNAALQLDKLQALSRVDRWVQLSGQTKLSMNSQQTTISGNLKIHKGLFELPKADKPTLDEDVVIESPQARTETASKLFLQSFALDFGDKPTVLPFKESEQFMLRGQGLNAALSGKLQLNGLLDALSATGTLDLTGTYLAYGQSLNIETGRLIFSGKLPNIGLDVLATRQVDTTKVGIQINGSLQTPRLKLVSTPETSNENKVALLVLGQPMSQVGSSDLALLSVAAGALLSQGDSVSLQTRLAQAVGLDSIDVRGSGPTNYAVSVGKRINRNLVVGYEKSIVGLLNVGKLTYQLTKRISIETRTGSENAMDVFYGFSFD
ncbi:translocation/assembly module TamB domain-containing protein [Methylophilus sp. YYY-1]|uniref:translocation/assembly module TamB domain-containing protein n=1 Tax=Methylophilus sp. YYY-1 TaxID=2682087 RepID=UPI0023B231B2|nr:translocation/assembly module TamB domain-containing protein [Methylophilus sp. YYY-1]MDF0378396.1 DUF490 domain-containing protein [Methylophilus sp. YYY-1]